MLTPRITNCTECSDISSLLEEIDCRMTELAKSLYNNVIFSLNQQVPANVIIDLLHYKRILIYRICNSEYAGEYSLNKITSRVKLLKFKS